MARALSVAVVQGGASMEAEVSRASARGVAEALVSAGHSVVRLELDAWLPETLRSGGFDVVFPVAHGAVGEDGALQGLLEVLDLPYVGSGVLASALAMNKAIARGVLEGAGLPVARGLAVPRPEGAGADLRARATEAVTRAQAALGGDLVVKPSSQGSALGVARFDAGAPVAQVAAALEAAWGLDDVALLEHFARGREITCGVLDLPPSPRGARALPPTEIVSPSDAFYTYEARYAPGRSLHTCPADIGADRTRAVQDAALAAHRALGCRDLSRVDLILGDGPDADALTVLEVNTMPGFTLTSNYPEAAARAGLAMPELCDAFVRAAKARGPTRRLPARPLPT